jgi:CO/xanthine dehydrogenase Mo-binding subunit
MQEKSFPESYCRPDAAAKAAGAWRFPYDHRGPEALWAGAKRAGAPHARLLGVETAAARALPGVVAVLTAADVAGSNRQGVVQQDQPVLVDDKVRHAGDAVALVVAEDRASLRRALELVEVRLEPLAPVLDPDQALAPGAPLVHEAHPTGNLLLEGVVERGEPEAALAAAAVVVELEVHTPRQEHAYLETEVGWARWEPGAGLEMVASTQTPFRDRLEMARAVGLEPESIRLRAPHPGGAFGGKDGVTVQSLLALAALAAPGRPVGMWWEREESFVAGCKRHPARLRLRLGADRQGRLLGLIAEATYDTGAYDHLGGVVAVLGLEHLGGPYRLDHARLTSRAVYTNNPVGGPFRGFGAPQAAAAVEQAMDELARRLELDPLELRRRNLPGEGGPAAAGAALHGVEGLRWCLDRLANHPLWTGREQWKRQAPPGRLRGVGVAALFHGMGYGPVVPDRAGSRLELTDAGRVRVHCGVVDMGQGNAGACLHLAAGVLNQPPGEMELGLPDTARALNGGSSSASRTTYTLGNATLAAAHALAGRLLAAAAAELGSPAAELELAPGAVRHREDGRELSLAALAGLLPPEEREVERWFQAPVSPETPSPDPAVRLHGLPHLLHSYAAHLCAVELDTLTGQVRPAAYLAFSDCGRVLHRGMVEQQMQGAIAQGLGWALMEDFACREGLPLAADLAAYAVPTALDVPAVELGFCPGFEPTGPGGLKGAGEIGVNGPLPATANAVADACGARPGRFPLTGQRVLALLAPGGGRAD